MAKSNKEAKLGALSSGFTISNLKIPPDKTLNTAKHLIYNFEEGPSIIGLNFNTYFSYPRAIQQAYLYALLWKKIPSQTSENMDFYKKAFLDGTGPIVKIFLYYGIAPFLKELLKMCSTEELLKKFNQSGYHVDSFVKHCPKDLLPLLVGRPHSYKNSMQEALEVRLKEKC